MPKHCLKCQKEIDENNSQEKYCMLITKRGLKIIAFECFHADCWKQFWDESVKMEIMKKMENKVITKTKRLYRNIYKG